MYAVCVFVCGPVHVYDQSDRCWAALVIDFNAYWAALPTGGCHDYWQDTILKRERHGTAGSVTEVLSHDKDKKGGRSVTGIHGSVTGVHGSVTVVQNNKSVTEGMEKRVGKEV